MATITEDYISFETAKLLKEKWFKFIENTDELSKAYVHAYTKEGKEVWGCYSSDYYPCITINMAMKWLREVHHWHIFVIPRWEDIECMPGEWEEKMVGYQYVIINIGEVNRKDEQPTTTALSSESACEAAIKYCLEHLI